MTAIGIGLSPVLGSKAATVVIAAPANLALSITGASKDVLTATWDAVSGATDYEVEYSDDGVTYTPVDTTALLTYGVTSADYVLGEVTHYIRVRATGGTWAVESIAGLLIGLVAYWKLDEASGSRADSVGSNTLTQIGTVGSAAGKIDNAADFSGGNYLNAADNADLSMGAGVRITINTWINPDATSGSQHIVAKRSGGSLEYYLRTSGTDLNLEVNGSDSVNNTASLSAATWAMATANYNGTHLRLSKNAGTFATTAFSADINNTVAPLGIGSYGAEEFTGLIDETGIWKRTLSDAEITALYNGGAGLTYPFTP